MMEMDLQSLATLFLVGLISTILVRTVLSRTSRPRLRLPPSPMALPVFGHLHLLGPSPHQAFHKLAARYGPLFYLRLGSVPHVVVSSPEIAKDFLRTHELAFSARPQSKAARQISYNFADFSFIPYGPYWKFMKKLIMSELFGSRMLDKFLAIRHDETQSFIKFLVNKSEARQEVHLSGELIRLTNNVISRMAISRRCSGNDDEAEEVKNLIMEIADLLAAFNIGEFVPLLKSFGSKGFDKRVKDVHRRFDVIMEKVITEHEEARRKKEEIKGDRVKDILDMLLDIAEDENSEIRLSRENIKAFLLDIIAAGTDTTALTIEWALAELINHPPLFKKLREELDSVVGKRKLVEENNIPNLPYLQAVIKETLRLHAPAPLIVRQSVRHCNIRGYDIPANARMFVNLWSISRDPNYWEDPFTFNPERFMPSGKNGWNSMDVRGQYFHFMPFGTGTRACPGTTLALHLLHVTIAAMIQCFDWKALNVGKDGLVDMAEGTGLATPMAHHLVCQPIIHFNPFSVTEN